MCRSLGLGIWDFGLKVHDFLLGFRACMEFGFRV